MPKESIGGFSWALDQLQDGQRLYRTVWKDWQYVAIERPNENSKMTCSFFYTSPEPGLLIPWTPSQSDLMAWDWEVVVKCRNCGK